MAFVSVYILYEKSPFVNTFHELLCSLILVCALLGFTFLIGHVPYAGKIKPNTADNYL